MLSLRGSLICYVAPRIWKHMTRFTTDHFDIKLPGIALTYDLVVFTAIAPQSPKQ